MATATFSTSSDGFRSRAKLDKSADSLMDGLMFWCSRWECCLETLKPNQWFQSGRFYKWLCNVSFPTAAAALNHRGTFFFLFVFFTLNCTNVDLRQTAALQGLQVLVCLSFAHLFIVLIS